MKISLPVYNDIYSTGKPILLTLILLGSYFTFFWLTYPEFLYADYGRHIPILILAWFIFDAIRRLLSALHSPNSPEERIHRCVLLDPHGPQFFIEIFILLFLSLAINLSVLFQRWTDGPGGWFSLGGLLTLSDASGYLAGAKSMLEFGYLDSWAARRPLGIFFYSALMKITGQNLMQTYLLTTVCVSLSFWVLALSVLRTHGFSASLMTLTLVSSYFSSHNGVYTTEPPGLMLGSIAIGLMWLGFSFKRIPYALLGLFIFGLALSVRAGPFFTLPFIILFIGWRFRSNKNFNLKTLGVACIVVTLSLGCGPLLLKVMGTDVGHGYQSNFAYTLYGLSKGGKAWYAIYDEHPELFMGNLSEDIVTKKIYEYSFDEITRDTRGFVATVATIWFDALRYPQDFFFPFNPGFNRKTFMALSCLALMSLLFLHNRRDRPLVFFVFLSLSGIVLSSPFLRLVPSPFFSDHTARVYAASMPFNCLAFGAGLGVFLEWVGSLSFPKKHFGKAEKESLLQFSAPAIFERSGFVLAIVLTILLVGMPFYVSVSPPKHSFEKERFECGQGIPMICRLTKGSYLEIVADGESHHGVPKTGISSFRMYNPSLGGEPVQFGNLQPGMFVTVSLNLLNPRQIAHLSFDEDISRYDGELVAICGTKDVSSSAYNLYHATVMKVIKDSV